MIELAPLMRLEVTLETETAAPRYAWLNRTLCVGTGTRLPAAVRLEFFEVK